MEGEVTAQSWQWRGMASGVGRGSGEVGRSEVDVWVPGHRPCAVFHTPCFQQLLWPPQLAQPACSLLSVLLPSPPPQVWVDVALNGTKIGRIEYVLFVKESPRAAENMRLLCSGGWMG